MRKLLIVDDSSMVREYIAHMISAIADIEIVGQAKSIAESLDALKTLSPDIIILDLHLPDGNGLKILPIVRKQLPQTKVVVLTNYPFPQHRKKALAAGAEYFFDKSLEFEKIVDVLKEANGHAIES